jgi:hypothetical protein
VGEESKLKRPRHKGERMTAEERKICAAIDEALLGALKPKSRRRLVAVRMVLQGERGHRMAQANEVAANTVGLWVITVKERGVSALVRKTESGPVERVPVASSRVDIEKCGARPRDRCCQG